MSFQANKKKKYLRSVIALLLLGEPIVLGGGPKSLGELLIVRTSRFLAEPEKNNKINMKKLLKDETESLLSQWVD